MIKISDIVQDILSASDLELEAMRQGVLNLSAYAEKIHPEVEKRAWKTVQKTTIVVALSRLQLKLSKISPLRPKIVLRELTVKSPLADITYEKTRETIKQSRSLSTIFSQAEAPFLTVTQGMNEITVIVSQDQLVAVMAHISVKPKSLFRDLVGITVTFSEKYLLEPNVIYAILAALAGKRINIIEIVSTYTELSVIISQSQVDLCIQTLNQFFPHETVKRVI